jgi:hypothetical protein
MSAGTAVGGLLLAYGPPVIFFLGFIAPRSQLLIMAVVAAFFWLLAVSSAGIVWAAIPPLQGDPGFHIPAAVLLQVSQCLFELLPGLGNGVWRCRSCGGGSSFVSSCGPSPLC